MTVAVRALRDPDERRAALPELARLRMAVFREWPYLYDGTDDYEAEYLAEFIAEPGSVLVIAQADDGAIVGAATASPMAGQKAEFQAPFEANGLDPATIFYFGESVLLPQARGQGAGHRFFDLREEAAKAAGARICCFCAVVRPADHPLSPVDPRDLHPFWRARGYAPVEGLVTAFDWKDIDQPGETPHPMQFWVRTL